MDLSFVPEIMTGDFSSIGDFADQDNDGNVIDNVTGVIGGVGNTMLRSLTGRSEGFGDGYSEGSAAGNRFGDGIADWWDSL